MSKFLLSASLGAVVALSTVATPANGQQTDHASVSVQRSDLDLTTAAGRKILETRITHAVSQVCPADNHTRKQAKCKRSVRAALEAQQLSTARAE
jgi:UrcA family protein